MHEAEHLLNWSSLKPIIDGLSWLENLGDDEIRHVKDETRILLTHLSESLIKLWEITHSASKISEKEFHNDFDLIYEKFKVLYYDPESYEAVRIHCTDLKRDVKLIKFKLARILRTDLGSWGDAERALQLGLLEDETYLAEYRKNFETLNQRLNDIYALQRAGKDAEALTEYTAFNKELAPDLDQLNDHINNIRNADTRFRELAG
jgi:hypothetical protein